jgi:hypothetical protein
MPLSGKLAGALFLTWRTDFQQLKKNFSRIYSDDP